MHGVRALSVTVLSLLAIGACSTDRDFAQGSAGDSSGGGGAGTGAKSAAGGNASRGGSANQGGSLATTGGESQRGGAGQLSGGSGGSLDPSEAGAGETPSTEFGGRGGAPEAGAASTTGGSAERGGSGGSGGTLLTGGSPGAGTGGAPASGGTRATGGSTAAGGTKATGGSTATGGTKATDYCSPNPCRNGGSCQNLTNGYKCTCTAKYAGDTCSLLRFERVTGLIEAISADASVVVAGDSGSANGVAFSRNTATGVQTSLGSLSDQSSVANSVSADGSVIVGYYFSGPEGREEAFRWTKAGGMKSIERIDSTSNHVAVDVSDDGQIVLCQTEPGSSEHGQPFLWTASGVQKLTFLSGAGQCWAEAISANGAAVVGHCNISGVPHPFLWTAATQKMQDLGFLQYCTSGYATDVSGDGAVVVGYCFAPDLDRDEAFRWTKNGGLELIETLLPSTGISAQRNPRISRDGSTIGGWSFDRAAGFNRGWMWDKDRGVRYLDALFKNAGFDLSGLQLQVAGISADGKTMTGVDGPNDSWIGRPP